MVGEHIYPWTDPLVDPVLLFSRTFEPEMRIVKMRIVKDHYEFLNIQVLICTIKKIILDHSKSYQSISNNS